MQLEEALARLIDECLPTEHQFPEIERYYRLLREYPSRPGKRLRARLTLLSTRAHGAPSEQGMTAAAAIELFQNWVLIHDDVEDDSDERRGSPTLHRQVGAPLAINVGDGLHAYMWQLLLSDGSLPRAALDEFLWMIQRTAEGQHLDLSWTGSGRFDMSEADYLEMVRLKTACYTVVAPLRLGAHCARVVPDARLTAAGEDLGIAFQIRDDVLNLTPGSSDGKEFAGDLFEGKRTLILAHFFSQASPAARAEAEELLSGVRSRRTSEDVERLLELLDDQGSLAYAQKLAEERAQRGLALLQETLGSNPDAVELIDLMKTLTSRKS